MKHRRMCLTHIRRFFAGNEKKETGCSGLQRCSQQSLQDRADRSIFSIGSGAAAVKRKNSRKMQKFRKQESTNISPRKVRFCLTSVLQIIIMKKLHRGVAQMVARMVRDHEAVSSNLATRTNEKACNCNGYRLFSCTFAGRFPFNFPFTGQKRCLTAQPPDTFSINFSMWSALLFFISSVTCP